MAKITDQSKALSDARGLQEWLNTSASLSLEAAIAAERNSGTKPVLARGVAGLLSPSTFDTISRRLYSLLDERGSYGLTPQIHLNGGIPNVQAVDQWYADMTEQLSVAAATFAFRGNGHFRPESSHLAELKWLSGQVGMVYRRLHTLIGDCPATEVLESQDILFKYIA